MPTPRWNLFAAVVVLATLALLSLSAASARVLAGEGTGREGDEGDREPGAGRRVDGETGLRAEAGDLSPAQAADGTRVRSTPAVPTGGALLANVALTHGVVAVTVVALAWVTAIPPSALGAGEVSVSAIGVGGALGLGLYLASEAGTALADRAGVEYEEHLRELLAPEGRLEWAVLLLLVLPIIAGAEELLFRAALIGALGAGFDLPLPALVVGSSVLFGVGHGAQGVLGVAVTAALGLVLGTAFVLTGSLAVVVVAHYVVNALEFVIREGVLG